ncbi:MAG: histidinol phosphate phosphatase [Alphaproteobacteria bacterium]|nr:histidinol phosphate phosphatase [Alphaproteobacteria bacterium]
MQEFVTFAKRMADAAGEIIRAHYRKPFEIISKSDASPVTVADRSVEERLRTMIEDMRPEDGILGEEFGIKPSKNGLTWVIDPIDGTKSFVIGRPTFGTLIALWEGDTPLLGLIDQPISKERWLGAEGVTTYNDMPVRTRRCTSIKAACSASTTPAMFNGEDALWRNFDKQTKMMAWGGDCYMYGLLASGFMDICVEASLSPYDFAALVPVVQNAGGWISDYEGRALTLKSEGRVIALGDPDLWPQVVPLLKSSA